MRRYQPDPKHPRRLTADEARRLNAALIDYSDIPPLDGEFFSRAKRMNRFYFKDPADAAWRRRQSQIDSDIAGLHCDPALERFCDEMDATGIEYREQIKRLKAYLRRRQRGDLP